MLAPLTEVVEFLLAVVGFVAGAIAAITGFGIGSLLTPVLDAFVETKLAVAVVAIPHFAGTVARFWMLRRHVDRRLLLRFGLLSAAGGLAGAFLFAWASSRALALVFGALLLLAGTIELTGWIARLRWGRRAAWVAGALSGLLGGMVGNQGGIRAAALLGLQVPKESFVATATAIALFVDAARLPVYLATSADRFADIGYFLPFVASVGVVLGTIVGSRVLRRLPESAFRRVVAVLLLVLGLSYLVTFARGSSPS